MPSLDGGAIKEFHRLCLFQRLLKQGKRSENASMGAPMTGWACNAVSSPGSFGSGDWTSVSGWGSHLPNSSIKGDGVRVFLSGRDRP